MFPGLLGKKILYLNDRHEEKDTEGELAEIELCAHVA